MFPFRKFSCSIVVTVLALGAVCASPHSGMAQTLDSTAAAHGTSVDAATRPGTPRQQEWLQATLEQRVRLAEEIGEQGARQLAHSKGWQAVFDGSEKSIPQGLDQVYRDADGFVHVVEAKGGGSQLGHAYGHPQGSSEWAVEAAKRTIRSNRASVAEKEAAKAVVEAAAKGKLQVHVVRTGHVLGEPTAAVLKQSVGTSEAAAKAAETALDDLARAVLPITDDAARAAKNAVSAAAAGGTVTRTVAKGAVIVGVVVDGGFRVYDGIETERRFASGQITIQSREIAHARNIAGMAGGWAGAAAGAKLGSLGGGAAGSCVAPGPGTAIGGVLGGVAGGVAGYIGGEAAAEAAAEWAVRQVHYAGTTISESANAAWTWATHW